MANALFRKLSGVLRKSFGPNRGVIPFGVGRIYQTVYRNWKNDPRPLLFILGSDAFYTVGINVHYLGAYQSSLTNFILNLRRSQSTTLLTGYTLYQLMKRMYPGIPRQGYRMYFTPMLNGKLASEGISQLPENTIGNMIAEPWVRRLNNVIRPKVISHNTRKHDEQESEYIDRYTIQTAYNRDRQKPFANRKGNVVQYRPREQGNEE